MAHIFSNYCKAGSILRCDPNTIILIVLSKSKVLNKLPNEGCIYHFFMRTLEDAEETVDGRGVRLMGIPVVGAMIDT